MGWLFKYFGVDLNIIFAAAEKIFGKNADLIKKAIEEGYQLGSEKEKLAKSKSKNRLHPGRSGGIPPRVAACRGADS